MDVLVIVAVQRRGRREALGHAAQATGQVQDPQADEHDRHRELHGQPDGGRDDHVEHDDQHPDDDDRDRVPEPPQRADQGRVRESPAAVQDRGDGDHVVGIGRVAHAEQEAEAGEREQLGHRVSMR